MDDMGATVRDGDGDESSTVMSGGAGVLRIGTALYASRACGNDRPCHAGHACRSSPDMTRIRAETRGEPPILLAATRQAGT